MPSRPRPPRILMLTGEASGDRYGGLLAAALRSLRPEVVIHGIGGPAMAAAGVIRIFDSARIAVTGVVEVLGALREVRRAWSAARDHLLRDPPDLVVLIDYPDFNLRFARLARRAGVPVVYFVGPQVWAWRRYRVRQIARDVDRMLVILPFEEAFYARHGIRATFVGHPLVDLIPATTPQRESAAALGLDPATPVLGLLPGSRRNEVRELLPRMLGAAGILRGRLPRLQCLLPLAPSLDAAVTDPVLADAETPVTVWRGEFAAAVSACTAALVASGTATLETGLLGVPLVVAYRLRPWTYRLARGLASVEDVGLPNLILGRRAVPECIQEGCTAERLAAEVAPLLCPGEARSRALGAIGELRARLGGGGAVPRAAEAVAAMLSDPAGRHGVP